MLSRFGLRFHMAASYVVVSAAAVLIVEAVLLAVFVPRIQSARDSVRKAEQIVAETNSSNAQTTAKAMAAEGAAVAGTAVSLTASGRPKMSDRALLSSASKYGFADQPVAGPQGPGRVPSAGEPDPGTARVLATVDGRVVASSAPKEFSVGSMLPARAIGSAARAGVETSGGQQVDWAAHPVELTASSRPDHRVVGIFYVRVPVGGRTQFVVGTRDSGGAKTSGGVQALEGGGMLWVPAVIVLVLLVPVGGLFGLLSTRWLIRRIRRLAAGTSAMARGDLRSRIPVSGSDEVGRLERSFNVMAERLEAAVQAERDTAGSAARRAERTRIARELHDSISQDLFSASLLAGGLRMALPSGSELQHQAELMERTMERTMLEMRAMLLELRPVALEDAGLAAAVEELCRAYEARLGIQISADIDSVRLKPPVEHVVLRVVQEAVGNAVRHGRPKAIELSVGDGDGQVTVMVRDDGRGFDQHRVGERRGMGLELMRERVGELGGEVQVASAPDQGTTVRVLIPDGVA